MSLLGHKIHFLNRSIAKKRFLSAVVSSGLFKATSTCSLAFGQEEIHYYSILQMENLMLQFVNGRVYFHFMREKSLIMFSDKDAGSAGSFKPSFCVVLYSFSRNC